MKTRKIVLVLVLFVVITAALLVDIFRRPCLLSDVSIPIKSEDSKVAVGQKLMNTYLKNYKYRQTCPTSWLKSYKINEVKADGFNPQQDNQFVVTVSYSVKPNLLSKSFWVSGNGKMEKTGWVDNKFSFLTIKNENGSYKLQGIGTGP